MANGVLVIGLSLSAAVGFAASSSLKHVSAGVAPDAQDMGVGSLARFVHATVKHRLWLGGIACDAIAVALQVLALHFGALAVVQPLLIAGLVFALVFRWLHDRRHVTGQQMAWALLLCLALAAFVVLSRGAPTGATRVDRIPAVVAGAVGAATSGACVLLARRMAGNAARAALLGVAVGLIYAATAALLKAVTNILAAHPVHVLYSWQLYATILLGGLGMLLNQLAFQAGPLAASLPATAAVDPLASIAIGVAVYDEQITRAHGSGVLLVGLLTVLGLAVVQLIRASPEIIEEPPAAADRARGMPEAQE